MVWIESSESWSGDDCREKSISMTSDGLADVDCECDVPGHYGVFLVLADGSTVQAPDLYRWKEQARIT